jgi:hypothetical protein
MKNLFYIILIVLSFSCKKKDKETPTPQLTIISPNSAQIIIRDTVRGYVSNAIITLLKQTNDYDNYSEEKSMYVAKSFSFEFGTDTNTVLDSTVYFKGFDKKVGNEIPLCYTEFGYFSNFYAYSKNGKSSLNLASYPQCNFLNTVANKAYSATFTARLKKNPTKSVEFKIYFLPVYTE